MVDANIFRAQTTDEKKDYSLPNSLGHERIFRKRLDAAERAFREKETYTPFDRNGAKFDFDDLLKTSAEKSMRSHDRIVDFNPTELAKSFDFTKYEDFKRWLLVGTSPVEEKKIVNGKAYMEKTGVWMNYQHREYEQVHCSVEVPMAIYEEKFKGKKAV